MPKRKNLMLQLEGTRIHAVSEGEGPLVVLLHGFPESWYSWRHQLTALARAGYRAVAIDQRGYGRSSKFPADDDYQIKSLVSDVKAVVSALGEERAVVVGHDWGAVVAWTCAWLHPDVFHGVVGLAIPFSGQGLIALPGSPFGEVSPVRLHKDIAGPGQDFYQDYFGALTPAITEFEADARGWLLDVYWGFCAEAMIGAGLRDLLKLPQVDVIRQSPLCIPRGAKMRDRIEAPDALPKWLSEEDLQFYVNEFEGSGLAGPLSFYRSILKSWSQLSAHKDTKLTSASMFIGGEQDVTTGWGLEAIQNVGVYATNYVGSHILPECGHWVQQECPDQVNDLLVDFLKRV